MQALRRRLSVVRMPIATAFTLKGFRRGHAQAIVDGGGQLKVLLDAADWTVAAFASYLNLFKIETTAVHRAAGAVPPGEWVAPTTILIPSPLPATKRQPESLCAQSWALLPLPVNLSYFCTHDVHGARSCMHVSQPAALAGD